MGGIGSGRKPKHGNLTFVRGRRIATPEYRSWQHMRDRCLNPLCRSFPFYGGKGIAVDPRWDTFETFLTDMGVRPTPQHSLDRKDGKKGYFKENCRWATPFEQARNRECVMLSPEKAQIIRGLYATGNYKQIELANQFGTSQSNVSRIIRGEGWVVQPC